MRHARKFIGRTLAALIVLALAIGAGYYLAKLPEEQVGSGSVGLSRRDRLDLRNLSLSEKRVVTVDEVQVELAKTGQFSTYIGEYTIAKTSMYTRYFLEDIALPGTTNRIDFECKGVVKVGYEVEDIAITVDNDSRKIYITLPPAKILDNYIIWDTVRCEERNNILNPIDFEQYQTLISEIESDGLAQVEAAGIYDEAEESMALLIRSFLSAFKDFEVVFQ